MVELTRPVRRKVYTRHHALVVTLTPEGVWVREPRRRVAYLLPYGVAFQYAVRMHVDAEKARKKAEKAMKRKARNV